MAHEGSEQRHEWNVQPSGLCTPRDASAVFDSMCSKRAIVLAEPGRRNLAGHESPQERAFRVGAREAPFTYGEGTLVTRGVTMTRILQTAARKNFAARWSGARFSLSRAEVPASG